MRPYNSLPRGQDINSYPSLAIRKASKDEHAAPALRSSSSPKRSPNRRTQSEDVYVERKNEATQTQIVKDILENSMESAKPPRINPLVRTSKENSPKSSPRSKLRRDATAPEPEDTETKPDEDLDILKKEPQKKSSTEKRVSFGSTVIEKTLEENSPVKVCDVKATKKTECAVKGPKSEDEEITPVELCDIEPLSGTVFRKVTVRRRRQEMRKVASADTGM